MILLYFRTRDRAGQYFMRLAIIPKIKAKGRERESGIKGNSELWNIIEWEGERKVGQREKVAYGGEGRQPSKMTSAVTQGYHCHSLPRLT